MYEERTYRNQMAADGLVQFNVTELESDLQIFADRNLELEARTEIIKYRKILTDYIQKNPQFLTSLTPIKADEDAADMIKHMCFAAQLAGVGPMAAVAGAVSQYVGLALLDRTKEIMLENGGDIFIKTNRQRSILVYAGTSPFSNKLALRIPASNYDRNSNGGDGDGDDDEDGNCDSYGYSYSYSGANAKSAKGGIGVCTSSGTLGHSLSFGKADAVVVVSNDTLVADAAATAIGNVVKTQNDIPDGLKLAQAIKGIRGVVIIVGDKLGAWGDIELIRP